MAVLAILLAPLGGGLPGCAYFNTFYEAKKQYAKAERLQRDSKSDKLNTEASRAYDAAIEKCVKVIFEQGGGWRAGIDDALFLWGACCYGKREYETAIKKFNEILLNYPDSDHVPDALFYTGLCYHRTRNYATAQRVFERVMRDYPDLERRDEILFITAQGLEAEGEDELALRQYRRLRDDFRESERREEALERIGDIYFTRGTYDSALVAFEGLAKVTRDDDLYFETELDVGACLVRLGDYDRALNIYESILPSNAEQNELGGRVWLAMAEAENRRGKYEEALEYLTRVSEHFANRGLGLEADFRLGYTNEVYLQNYEKAREHYEIASRSRQRSVFKEQAERRLKNLSYLEELQASLDGETSAAQQRADAALKVAEFALFESDDTEGALRQYSDVIRGFPDSEAATRAAYARAWIHHSRTDSIALAAREYEELVERHPGSPQAGQALKHLTDIGIEDDRRAALGLLVRSAKEREQRLADSLALLDSIAAADSMVVAADSLAALAARAKEDAPVAADSSASSIPGEGRPPFTSFPAEESAGGAGRKTADRDSIYNDPVRPPRPMDGRRRGPRAIPAQVDSGAPQDSVSIPAGTRARPDTVLTPPDTLVSPGAPGPALPDSLPRSSGEESS